ncbi:hypothetical protein P3S68_001068 [Capsicum galapagoense]
MVDGGDGGYPRNQNRSGSAILPVTLTYDRISANHFYVTGVDDRAYTSTYWEELKYYLRSPPEDRRRRINTLDWWRSNETQYPVLSRLTRDILNVPISTVASESAFSQGR